MRYSLPLFNSSLILEIIPQTYPNWVSSLLVSLISFYFHKKIPFPGYAPPPPWILCHRTELLCTRILYNWVVFDSYRRSLCKIKYTEHFIHTKKSKYRAIKLKNVLMKKIEINMWLGCVQLSSLQLAHNLVDATN